MWQEGLIVARWTGKNSKIKNQRTPVSPANSVHNPTFKPIHLTAFNPKLKLISKNLQNILNQINYLENEDK